MPSDLLDGDRLWLRLAELAAIGATPSGGVNRPALSSSEATARRQVIGWAEEIGLVIFTDPAGNLFLRLAGASDGAEPVLCGSYLDTQPNGGKYSGSYGMLAAVEALAAIAALGTKPKRPIIAASWMNGEGSRFSPGYMGSEAFAGRRPLEKILAARDQFGTELSQALQQCLAAEPDMPQGPLGFACASYVEAHLEQGPVLEEAHRQIGIVTGTQGVRRFQIRVEGEAAHAGVMPRKRRRDALSATVRMISALEDFYAAPDVVFTVGQLSVEPNAPSVVPRTTTFSVDIRHQDDAVLTRLGDTIRLICETERGPCTYSMTESASMPPIEFDGTILATIATASKRLNLTTMDLVSLGGHDAQILKWVCPSGIIFIPCLKGISHSEAESIDPMAAANGAKVLADTLWDLAQQ